MGVVIIHCTMEWLTAFHMMLYIHLSVVECHQAVDLKPKSKLTFECLNLKRISEEMKQHLYQKLYSESVEMMFKFQKLFSSTRKSLKERKISSQQISNHVECLGSLKPAFDDSDLPVFRRQIPRLQHSSTVDDAMSVISSYCSFFNFHILELIIDELGSDEDAANLSKYKDEFSEYAKRHVFECPTEVGTMTDNDVKMFVILDETYDNCSLSALHLFTSKVQEVLKVSSGSGLKLCQIEPGSLKLTFQLPFSALRDIFPLSSEQEVALAGLGIDNLWLIYQFNRQQYQVELELRSSVWSV